LTDLLEKGFSETLFSRFERSESFKVDVDDFGSYYYTKFGGNWIRSLAAH